jgi:hypothetical protein
MPYYIRSTKGGGQMLVEETRRDVREHMKSNLDVHYSPVSGAEAHAWVKRGNIHGTGLYTDSVPTRNWPCSRVVVRKAQADPTA